MGATEKIKEIEKEMARTQKNKATNFHLGLLKGKIARLRRQLMDGNDGGKSSSSSGDGFEILKSGDARVALIGFPSVGKSTLLTKLTETKSASASYEFTTLTCIPGVIKYKNAKIQLLDLPGIIEQAATGKGRGRQVIGVARTADLILMLVDSEKGLLQIKLLTKELETAGIRLNKNKPKIHITKSNNGGIVIQSLKKLDHIDVDLCKAILKDYKIHNAEINIKDNITIDDLIDHLEGNRRYIPCIYGFNKIDNITIERIEEISKMDHSIVLSANLNLNLKRIVIKIWKYLNLIRIFTKKKGFSPDLNIPIILRNGSTIKNFCHRIHRDLVQKFRYALVWGTSAKHNPQTVGLNHLLEDEDVVQIIA